MKQYFKAKYVKMLPLISSLKLLLYTNLTIFLLFNCGNNNELKEDQSNLNSINNKHTNNNNYKDNNSNINDNVLLNSDNSNINNNNYNHIQNDNTAQQNCNLENNINNEWQICPPSSQGLSDELITSKLYDDLENLIYGNIDSVIIIKNNTLVFEKYLGMQREILLNKDDIHQLQSVTKSITSVLIGIAIDKGFIGGVTDPLELYFPNYTHLFYNEEPITLHHLITMTLGTNWKPVDGSDAPDIALLNEIFYHSSGEEIIDFILNRNIIYPPGTKFNYNSGASVVLGEIIRKATNMTVIQFARTYLFEPLGIKDDYWLSNLQGVTHTGGGLMLKPRDIAKIGQLFINDGKWNNNQILSSKWIQDSIIPHINEFSHFNESYGYQWWIWPDFIYSQDLSIYLVHAEGYLGQSILIVQEHNLVVVINANDTYIDTFGILKYILKAIY